MTAKSHSEFFLLRPRPRPFKFIKQVCGLWDFSNKKLFFIDFFWVEICEARYSNDELQGIKKVDVVGIDMENLFPVFFAKFKCNVELIAICSFKIRCK